MRHVNDLWEYICVYVDDLAIVSNDLWEYICVYVDDLAIVSMDAQGICDVLVNKYNYKLKGVGPISYHIARKTTIGTSFKISVQSPPCFRETGPPSTIK